LLKTSVVPELMRLHTCQTTAKENLGPEIRIIKMAAFETFCVARKKKNQQFLVSVFFPKTMRQKDDDIQRKGKNVMKRMCTEK
jgi:hypothetical protein